MHSTSGALQSVISLAIFLRRSLLFPFMLCAFAFLFKFSCVYPTTGDPGKDEENKLLCAASERNLSYLITVFASSVRCQAAREICGFIKSPKFLSIVCLSKITKDLEKTLLCSFASFLFFCHCLRVVIHFCCKAFSCPLHCL